MGNLQRVVGRNLRAYRLARGLSQEQFAHAIGYHRTYVGGLERGERNITLNALEHIADRLSLEPLELLREEDHQRASGPGTFPDSPPEHLDEPGLSEGQVG